MNMSGFYSAFYSVIKLMLPLGSFRSMHIVYPKMLNTVIKKNGTVTTRNVSMNLSRWRNKNE